ncbi:L-aspartate oxidase [Agathobacter ruminis]|uniref:L-aspartate oxidase n=1 Tax=Agathobacter ruminis TaxID=1712665 RepID=A0A2G3DZG7_9FIRM|nr:FAD-binding protein [Agathobacter ruminis]PHU36361.1 L-aspartate oxidase [Agathobacter ruminis]
MEQKYDVIIVGTGAAGLFCALSLPRNKKILCISKDALDGSDSFLAQGGICMLRDESDYDSYFEDTMRAGHYENRKESVEIMIRSSQQIIRDLVGYGVEFEQTNGEFLFTREGAHSNNRILFHADVTGREITSKLLARVQELDNVTLMAHTTMVELALALYHDVRLENCDYVQIHPTTLFTRQNGRSFLISESVRGEGAVLRDKDGNRFTDELQPRDVVSAAIYAKMKEQGTEHVWLDFSPIPKEEILNHFPNIYKHCVEAGYDPLTDWVPVVPAQHYFMGGIYVDKDSRTTMKHLYAVGETSCNGVHGRNRLASNSLLESLVFAKRAANDIAAQNNFEKAEHFEDLVNIDGYEDLPSIMEYYHAMVVSEIKKEARLRAQKEATA